MRIRVFPFLWALALLVTGCSDKPSVEIPRPVVNQIRISEDSQDYFDLGLTFSEEGASESITFKATAPWVSSFADVSALEWLTIDPPFGEAGIIEMTIAANPNAGEERSTVLVLQCGAVKKRLTISQEGKPVDPTKVQSITLSKTELVMAPGEVEELVATVLPETAQQTVRWSVSDDTVVLVDNGTVIAISEGTATITATAGDKSATCQVTVKEEGPEYQFFITPTSINLEAGEADIEITVTCTGGYHLSSFPDWITNTTPENNGHVYTFHVAANPNTEARNDVIVFCDDKGLCLSCMVKQKGKTPDTTEGGNEDIDDGDPINW